MILFSKKLKNTSYKLQATSYKLNGGMTYVEIIVVLGIFAVMSSIILFNYKGFQAKVDIKNLASDIALKVVEAQKSSLDGKLPLPIPPPTWKPSYGVYFDVTPLQQFIYFVDLDSSKNYESSEKLDTLFITKDNFISRIDNCGNVECSLPTQIQNPLSITFTRPNYRANFAGAAVTNYVQITIESPSTASARIKIYPSGRVQVN